MFLIKTFLITKFDCTTYIEFWNSTDSLFSIPIFFFLKNCHLYSFISCNFSVETLGYSDKNLKIIFCQMILKVVKKCLSLMWNNLLKISDWKQMIWPFKNSDWICRWFDHLPTLLRELNLHDTRLVSTDWRGTRIDTTAKVIYPKYSKHWLSTVAHTIDCLCAQ